MTNQQKLQELEKRIAQLEQRSRTKSAQIAILEAKVQGMIDAKDEFINYVLQELKEGGQDEKE